uniref:UDP-n-acetyl-d-mannosaminuronate dehydrogenase n=1 Tax=uncultured Rhizobiales bacterium HF4000_32B18 TaxID=710780 RepID=E0XWC9_9HYPH|nr:UDP-n-acetyl-d-mannosaminuronate dehydrogenase [uncultured Rhizobiales bacterium HF4000_32B18]
MHKTRFDGPIAVIGLGYVGLPLAVAFARTRPVIGFDVDAARVAALNAGRDATQEVPAADLEAATHLTLTADPAALAAAEVFIVAVPTPVDAAKRPDLTLLEAASRTVGAAMRPGSAVIYESTVFPGCTRSVCVPILEAASGLSVDVDFVVGYSPERVNPGDRAHRLETIVKVTSGSTPEAADAIDALYAGIVTAGTHKAASIEVAEAAKVIENTQRDLNIALMNELAILFHRLGLDSKDVFDAARTKWNFLPFRPGLVGGHCIGVDPYYLTFRAQEVGYHPDVILAGRRINDGMGAHVAGRVMRLMLGRRLPVVGSRILVLGLAFKENCPDLRNTRVIDVVTELTAVSAEVDVWDPWVDPAEAKRAYGLDVMTDVPERGVYDALVLAVAHDDFVDLGPARIRDFGTPGAVLFDVKSVFERADSDDRL